MELGAQPGRQDARQGVRVLQEGRYEDQQRREREEPLQPDLHECAGEEVDHPCDEQDDDRLPHDPPHDREMAPESVDRLEEAEGAGHGCDQRRRSLEPLDEDRRQPQRRQRRDVADGGDQGRRNGVEVPSATVGQQGDPQRSAPDDHRSEHAADDRDRDEVGDRKRFDGEGGRDDVRGRAEEQARREREVPAAERVLSQEAIAAEVRLELPGVDAGPETRSERTEDVAPHPDRSGDEDDQSGQLPELLVHEAERQPGEKVAAG